MILVQPQSVQKPYNPCTRTVLQQDQSPAGSFVIILMPTINKNSLHHCVRGEKKKTTREPGNRVHLAHRTSHCGRVSVRWRA